MGSKQKRQIRRLRAHARWLWHAVMEERRQCMARVNAIHRSNAEAAHEVRKQLDDANAIAIDRGDVIIKLQRRLEQLEGLLGRQAGVIEKLEAPHD